MNPKKVLFVYKYLTLGGVETVLRARLDGLERRGIEAHAWFFHDYGGRAVFTGREDRIRVGSVDDCLAAAAAEGFDLLSTIDTEEVLPGFAEGHCKLPRLLVECHSSYPESLEYLRTLPASRPAAVLVPSEHQRRVVRERVGEGMRIEVVPNPLRQAFVDEPSPFAAPLPRPAVAWIGRLDDLKNWKGFLDTAGILRRRRVDVEFWIAGKPIEAAGAKALLEHARDARVLDRLRWYRALPHDRVPALLDAVRDSGGLMVLTSRAESFGMTLAEAMARACAVAAPDQPPFTEFVTEAETGTLFRPGSPESAADQIQKLLEDGELRSRCGQKARETVLARFAPDPALKVLADILKNLAGPSPAGIPR
jgi:glycosyltransferase involved in cell wall biosynthesis